MLPKMLHASVGHHMALFTKISILLHYIRFFSLCPDLPHSSLTEMAGTMYP